MTSSSRAPAFIRAKVWSTRDSSSSAVSVRAWTHPVRAHHRIAVPGQEHLGAAARGVVEGQHPAEGLGPLQGVALDLLGIAGVGRGPDEQVAAAQHPGSGNQVQVWSSVSPLAWWSSARTPADVEVEMVAVGAVGIAVLGGPLEGLDVELPPVDDAVVAGGPDVAVEAGRKGLVGHHHRCRPAGLGRLRRPDRDAEDVVDVAVGVDGGVEAVGPPGPQGVVDLGARNGLPVSTSTRPSSVLTAETLANDGTKPTPSATSARPPPRD